MKNRIKYFKINNKNLKLKKIKKHGIKLEIYSKSFNSKSLNASMITFKSFSGMSIWVN